jgi:hypothetical protein
MFVGAQPHRAAPRPGDKVEAAAPLLLRISKLETSDVARRHKPTPAPGIAVPANDARHAPSQP